MKKIKSIFALLLLFIVAVSNAQQQTSTPTLTDTLSNKPQTRVKEFGIGFSNLNSYSLQYRWGNPKVLYRINANVGYTGFLNSNSTSSNYANAGLGYSTTDVQTKTPVTLSTSVGFSVLSLKQINTKFGLMLGGTANLTYSYTTGQNIQTNASQNNNGNATSQSTTTKTNSITLQPSIGFVLGAYYKINPSFFIYAEIAPNIYYAASQTSSSITNTSQPSGISYKSGDKVINSGNLGLSGLTNSGATITLAYRITKIKPAK